MRIVGALVRVALLAAATCTASQFITHVRGDSSHHMGLGTVDDANVDKIYCHGKLGVNVMTLSADGLKHTHGRGATLDDPTLAFPPPPKPLIIATPSQGSTGVGYPLVLLLPGFNLRNGDYKQLLEQVASHGYIVVAPQLYSFTLDSSSAQEMKDASLVLTWLQTYLPQLLPPPVNTSLDLSKVILAGHSRGGKAAFGLALGLSPSTTKFAAIIGIDPVDGADKQTKPEILHYRPHHFNLGFPTLVIGSGLGSVPRAKFLPPCVPPNMGHDDFFRESSAPAFHFVPVEYGHLDFLDDNAAGIVGRLGSLVCSRGAGREPMRRFTAGLIVAFLNSYLKGEEEAFTKLLSAPQDALVKLKTPEFYIGGGAEARREKAIANT